MPSIRKKVAGFIRQLSNQSNNDSGDGAPRSPGCFIQKYLSGDVRRQQPDILYGKSCQELPVKQIGCLFPNIFAAFTGPEAGLTTVNRKERHLSTTDPDVDYIDKEDESPTSRKSSKRRHWGAGEGYFFSSNYGTYFIMRKSLSRGRGIPFVDNSVMNIRVMGNVYTIGKRSVETSMSDIHLFAEGRRPSNSNNVVKPDAERVDNSDCCRVGMNGNNTVSSLVEGVPAIGEAPTDVPPTVPEENFETIARSTNNDNENNNEMFCVDVESNYLTSVIPPPAEYSTSDFEPQTVGCPEEDGDIPSWSDVPDSGPMRSSSDSELNRILRKSVSAPCGTEVDSDNVFLPDTEDTCDFDLCDIAKTITQNELILNNNDKDSVQSFFGCPDYMVDVGTSTNVAGLGFDLDSIHINNNSSACLLNVNPSSNGRTPDQANKEAQKQNGHTNGDVASDENKNQVEELPFKPTTRKDGSYSHSKSSGGKSRKFHRERPSAGGTTSVGGTLAATQNEDIAGVVNWNRSHSRAYGAATTLYECHPVTHQNAGNPIADAFAIVARENSAILALADGVNWGEKACIAARCAVHGCVEYLNKALFGSNGQVSTTADVFVALLRSFHAAHSLILQEDGMLTTLTTAVVLPLKDSSQYVVCVCNVGDSLAYVYSKKYGVREITQGSHDIHSMRDMRDALGALGPVDGQNPELNNLTCSMTVAEAGDIVFLTSDGISDNFDPVVGKFAMPKKADAVKTSSISTGKKQKPIPTSASAGNVLDEDVSRQEMFLPMVEAHQRHELTLLRMEDLLNHGVSGAERPCQTAQELCEQMVDFATKLTVAKRRILEDPDLYTTGDAELSRAEQRCRRKKVCEKLAMVPGKLDHASVVAYMVGEFQEPRKLETVREIGESDEKTTSGGRNVPHNVKKTRENKENLSPNPSLRLEADRSVLLETVV